MATYYQSGLTSSYVPFVLPSKANIYAAKPIYLPCINDNYGDRDKIELVDSLSSEVDGEKCSGVNCHKMNHSSMVWVSVLANLFMK